MEVGGSVGAISGRVLRALLISTPAPCDMKVSVHTGHERELEEAVFHNSFRGILVCRFYFFLWALVSLCPLSFE